MDDLDLDLSLTLGPDEDSLPMDVLRRAWSVYGDELRHPARPGSRCWGEWVFEIGEEPPEGEQAQVMRLLELGQLTDEEREQLRERAQGAIRHAEWMNHCEDLGGITTGPRGAAAAMRARRDENARQWRLVLEAVESCSRAIGQRSLDRAKMIGDPAPWGG